MERNEVTGYNITNQSLLDAELCLNPERTKSTRNLNDSDTSAYGPPKPSWFRRHWKVVGSTLGVVVLTILCGAFTWVIIPNNNGPPNRNHGVPEKYNFDKCSFYQTIYSQNNDNDDNNQGLVRIAYKFEDTIFYESTGSLIAGKNLITY